MSVTDVLSWAIGLISKFFDLLNSFSITSGVSLLSFSIAVILLVIIIGSIVMRS